MKNKQTSIDWLIEQIKSDQNQKALSASQWMQVIKQAKEMNKQEIIDAMFVAFKDGLSMGAGEITKYEDWEQYYNETYNER